jgi:hypothetical protein
MLAAAWAVKAADFAQGIEFTADNPSSKHGMIMQVRELNLETEIHPIYLIDHDDRILIEMYLQGMGDEGSGILPEAGGMMDQAAVTMESLGVIKSTVARIRAANRPKRGFSNA